MWHSDYISKITKIVLYFNGCIIFLPLIILTSSLMINIADISIVTNATKNTLVQHHFTHPHVYLWNKHLIIYSKSLFPLYLLDSKLWIDWDKPALYHRGYLSLTRETDMSPDRDSQERTRIVWTKIVYIREETLTTKFSVMLHKSLHFWCDIRHFFSLGHPYSSVPAAWHIVWLNRKLNWAFWEGVTMPSVPSTEIRFWSQNLSWLAMWMWQNHRNVGPFWAFLPSLVTWKVP